MCSAASKTSSSSRSVCPLIHRVPVHCANFLRSLCFRSIRPTLLRFSRNSTYFHRDERACIHSLARCCETHFGWAGGLKCVCNIYVTCVECVLYPSSSYCHHYRKYVAHVCMCVCIMYVRVVWWDGVQVRAHITFTQKRSPCHTETEPISRNENTILSAHIQTENPISCVHVYACVPRM